MTTTNTAANPTRPLPRRAGLLGKVLVLLVPLVLVLGGLVALATIEAQAIRVNLLRVVEEDRELELSKSLAAELIGAQAWAVRGSGNGGSAAAGVDDLAGHLRRARAIVDLFSIDAHQDPSDPRHQNRERTLYGSMLQILIACEKQVLESSDWTGLAERIEQARRQASVLEAESKEEAHLAATDLDRRVYRLVNMLYLVAAAGVVTMLLLASAFRRMVLHPLRLLQQAALDLSVEKFSGAGGHGSVPVLSRDEFGQLTHAFNEMAARLATSHEELQDRVRERTRELIRTARLADLGTIAAGIAHEINNPLSSIAAGVEGVQRDLAGVAGVPPETVEYLDIVVKEAYRAKDIASRLLRFGRQSERKREPVWLQHEAREVVAMLGFQANQRRQSIEVHVPEDTPAIQGDPSEWRQVFFNLLRNALDATPSGGGIRIDGEHQDDAIRLRIRDTGPGFPEEALDQVFEPFFTTKDPGQGTGLGLAIVERIVREYGGEVSAANWERGGEIRIELRLPAA